MFVFSCSGLHDKTGSGALKSKENYGYSEALIATWQREAGRADGVTHSE